MGGKGIWEGQNQQELQKFLPIWLLIASPRGCVLILVGTVSGDLIKKIITSSCNRHSAFKETNWLEIYVTRWQWTSWGSFPFYRWENQFGEVKSSAHKEVTAWVCLSHVPVLSQVHGLLKPIQKTQTVSSESRERAPTAHSECVYRMPRYRAGGGWVWVSWDCYHRLSQI